METFLMLYIEHVCHVLLLFSLLVLPLTLISKWSSPAFYLKEQIGQQT